MSADKFERIVRAQTSVFIKFKGRFKFLVKATPKVPMAFHSSQDRLKKGFSSPGKSSPK